MPVFVLERVIRCTPEAAFELSLDSGLHVRSMAAHRERMLAGPPGERFEEGDTVTWQARHFGTSHLRRVITERNDALSAELEA